MSLHLYLFTVAVSSLCFSSSLLKSIVTSRSTVSLCVFPLLFCLLVAVIVMFPSQTLFFYFFTQHFREHLDKLFAQGIGMLDIALTEAFNLLGDVSNTLMHDLSLTHTHSHAHTPIHRKETVSRTKLISAL